MSSEAIEHNELPSDQPRSRVGTLLNILLIAGAVACLMLIGLMAYLRLDHDRAQAAIKHDFVFPLVTTKQDMLLGSHNSQGSLTWSSIMKESYHHGYLAADLHVKPGTTVVAAKGGKVIMLDNDRCDGGRHFANMMIQGSDGFIYYYAHLAHNSFMVRTGDTVQAGNQLAKVGTVECSENTAPHLHLDISRVTRTNRSGITGKLFLLDPQPALTTAYKSLPER